MIRTTLVLLTVLAACLGTMSQEVTHDKALGAKISGAGFKTLPGRNGAWESVVKTPSGKTRLITVESRKLSFRNTEWRQIYGCIPVKPSEKTFRALLDANRSSKLGAWELSPDGKYAAFTCRIPADAQSAYIAACMVYVVEMLETQSALQAK